MSAPVVTFKKAPRRPNQSRKRSSSPVADEAGPSTGTASTSSVVRPTKKSILNPLVQGTKRRRDPNEEANGTGLDDFDYKADEGLLSKGDEFATRSTEYDLETADGGKADQGKKVKLNEDGEIDDGLYRGAANYHKPLTKLTDVMDSKMSHGPVRATANVRTITMMDYQPDVCKDYKETGFCGYGDSCKFMHDRGDYLAGWQLDKIDPSSGQPVIEEEDEEEEVPFACLICRQPFTDPVITKCGHYFCMNCAITRFIKSPKCYACGAPTSGIFNKAERIIAKIEARNKKKREAKGTVDDEDDDGGIEIGGAPSDDDAEEGGAREEGEEEDE